MTFKLKSLLFISFVLSSSLQYAQILNCPKYLTLVDSTIGDLDDDFIPELVVIYNLPQLKDSLTYSGSDYENYERKMIVYKNINNSWLEWKTYKDCLPGALAGNYSGDPLYEFEIINGSLVLEFGSVNNYYNHSTFERYKFNEGELYLREFRWENSFECTEYDECKIDLVNGYATYEKGDFICDDDGDRSIITSKDVYKSEIAPIAFQNRLKDAIILFDKTSGEMLRFKPF